MNSKTLLLEASVLNVENLELVLRFYVEQTHMRSDQGKDFFMKTIRKQIINGKIPNTLRVATLTDIDTHYDDRDKVPSWMTDAFNKGELYLAITPDGFRGQLEHIGHWIYALENDAMSNDHQRKILGTRALNKLSKMQFEDAVRESDAYFRRGKTQKDLSGRTLVLNDGEFLWYRLDSQEAYTAEGRFLQNCIGSYYTYEKSIHAEHPYEIFVMKDKGGESHIGLRATVHKDGLQLDEFKGKNNKSPKKEYRPTLLKFLNTYFRNSRDHNSRSARNDLAASEIIFSDKNKWEDRADVVNRMLETKSRVDFVSIFGIDSISYYDSFVIKTRNKKLIYRYFGYNKPKTFEEISFYKNLAGGMTSSRSVAFPVSGLGSDLFKLTFNHCNHNFDYYIKMLFSNLRRHSIYDIKLENVLPSRLINALLIANLYKLVKKYNDIEAIRTAINVDLTMLEGVVTSTTLKDQIQQILNNDDIEIDDNLFYKIIINFTGLKLSDKQKLRVFSINSDYLKKEDDIYSIEDEENEDRLTRLRRPYAKQLNKRLNIYVSSTAQYLYVNNYLPEDKMKMITSLFKQLGQKLNRYLHKDFYIIKDFPPAIKLLSHEFPTSAEKMQKYYLHQLGDRYQNYMNNTMVKYINNNNLVDNRDFMRAYEEDMKEILALISRVSSVFNEKNDDESQYTSH